MDLAALKSEITQDPQALGYSGKGDEACANLLNTPNRTINRESIDGGTLAAALVAAEYAALTGMQRQFVDLVAGAVSIPWTANLKTQLGSIFGAGTTTRTNMLALQSRPGSRGEELGFGLVTPSDVAKARLV